MVTHYGGWALDAFRDGQMEDWQRLVDDEAVEGPTLQAKWHIHASDVAKWVCAFANGEGGVLLGGVKTETVHGRGDVIKEIPGTQSLKLSGQTLQDIICREVDPPPVPGDYRVTSAPVGEDGARVYAVFVPRGEGGPYQCGGKYLQPAIESATPMADRQVRDAMGRGQKPEFDIEVRGTQYTEHGELAGLLVRVLLSNKGKGTARDLIVLLRSPDNLAISGGAPARPGTPNFVGGVAYGLPDRTLSWKPGVMPPQLARTGSFIVRFAPNERCGTGSWLIAAYADGIEPQVFRIHAEIKGRALASQAVERVQDLASEVEWTWGGS